MIAHSPTELKLPSYWRLLPFTLGFTMLIATLFVVQMSAQRWLGAELYPSMFKEYLLNYGRNAFFGLVAPLVILFTFRYPIEAPMRRQNILRHLAAYGLFTATFAAYRLGITMLTGGMEKGDTPWMVYKIYLTLALNSNVWMYGPALVAGHLILYFRRLRERELQAEKLRTELVRSELQALRAQLHPHFLFNTLHSISALIRTSPQSADKMLMRLSDLLRTTLENSGVQEVALKTEIEMLENYLEIEQVRFQDRLRVHMEIADEVLDAKVPFLSMQPIAENCIRHGIAKLPGSGEIIITARPLSDKLEITIADNGPGFRSHVNKAGVGITNTRARLQRLYGDAHSFEATNRREGGALVRMVIPLHMVTESTEAEVASQRVRP